MSVSTIEIAKSRPPLAEASVLVEPFAVWYSRPSRLIAIARVALTALTDTISEPATATCCVQVVPPFNFTFSV